MKKIVDNRTSTTALSSENLTNILWNTLKGLQSGTVDARVASAIASQSREIVRVIRTQMSYATALGATPKNLLDFNAVKKGDIMTEQPAV